MMKASIKQNFFSIAIFLLIGIFLVPAIASAFRGGPGKSERGMGMHMQGMQWTSFRIWNNAKIVEELELTDEQIGKLKEADFAMKENHLELRSQLNRLNLEMEKAFSEETINDSEVIESANKMAELRNKLFMDRVEARLKMTKILTDDQYQKLETLQERNPENCRKFGKFGGDGRNRQKNMMQP
jgi:Spy/CpxP family protein refolding chaperone